MRGIWQNTLTRLISGYTRATSLRVSTDMTPGARLVHLRKNAGLCWQVIFCFAHRPGNIAAKARCPTFAEVVQAAQTRGSDEFSGPAAGFDTIRRRFEPVAGKAHRLALARALDGPTRRV